MTTAFTSLCTPLFWPIPHLFTSFRLKSLNYEPVKKAKPFLDFAAVLSTLGSCLRSFSYAVFCIYVLYNDENPYPAFGRAKILDIEWMWPILLRNIVATWLICGFWDWFLYFGPMKSELFKYKIVQRYPSMAQMKHDALFTTLSSVWATGIEIMCCYYWANGVFPIARTLSEKPILHAVLASTIVYWRTPHFHATHRLMHPWKLKGVPDVGKFLYRQIHSLHHKSSNITAFSGTNMHPIESTVYYTACLLVIPLGVHPTIVLACIVSLAMDAWLGHDGFLYPGSGDYYHELHHLHFDCNYGTPHIPLDWLFGSYVGAREEVSRIWGNVPAGEKANDTFVQHNSKSKDRVE